jgi:signal transduction histidine kinase/CheY-like chemotaxis protein
LTPTEPVRPVQISPEPALTALAQLGALKLQCERSFISLIDHNSLYLLAEATKSVSLRKQDIHQEGDALYLGIQTLPLHWGICPSTIKTFTEPGNSLDISTPNITANKSRYIIRDFLKEAGTKDRPYVVGWPYMRFYAEVPIRSPTGFVIGSYCVVDNKSRQDFGDAEVGLLQEISDAIGNHLELMRMKQDFERAERLMKGLSFFVEGQSSIRASSGTGPPPPSLPGNGEANTISSSAQSEVGGATSNSSHTLGFDDVSEPLTDPMEMSVAVSRRAIENSDIDAKLKDTPMPSATMAGTAVAAPLPMEASGVNAVNAAGRPSSEGALAPSSIKRTCSRASNLIRESMDLCGVVFLDASLSGLATCSTLCRSRPIQLPDGSDDDGDSSGDEEWAYSGSLDSSTLPGEISKDKASPKPSEMDQREATKECEMLGQSLNTASLSRAIPEFVLRRLLRKYPHGQIFSSERSTFADNCAGKLWHFSNCSQPNSNQNLNYERGKMLEIQADSRLLFERLPGAQSIIFYPLWDSQKARWFAGCIGWTTDPKRALQSEEVTYLAAFGNSVMAEINRIAAVANDRAKSDFISNISHELRTPLHGILASAELLQDSSTGAEQDSMIEMVHVCGRTLLDTMNHLLDYAKINYLSKSKGASSDASLEREGVHESLGLVSKFDLSELVEEVVESVYTGYQHQRQLSAGFKGASFAIAAGARNANHATTQQNVSVVLNIRARSDWTTTSEVGAWRRIVMNLFGNSLKYTKSGFIEVAIWADESSPVSVGSKRAMVHLSVTDTGKGISADYLKHRLWTPFAQEDVLSVGAGLGLSIVQQIVTALRGTIHIDSTVGSGTKVTVSIPLNERPGIGAHVRDTKALLQYQGLTVCLVLLGDRLDTGPGSAAPGGLLRKRRNTLHSSLSQVLTNTLGMKVVSADSDQSLSADLFMIEQEPLEYLYNKAHSYPQLLARIRVAPLIVLGQFSVPKSKRASGNPVHATYITQPFGPVKLAKALNHSLRPERNVLNMTGELMAAEPHGESINGHSESIESKTGAQPIPTMASPQSNTLPTFRSGMTEFIGHDPPRILLVDDNDINLKIMVTYMRKLYCSYEVATDGLQAYEKYRDSAEKGLSFNYVLMDVSMPVMDGLSATREIRALERKQALPATTIIALTGLASTKTEQEAFASGVNLFLTKPVQLKKLKDVLHFDNDQIQARQSQTNGGTTKKRKVADTD